MKNILVFGASGSLGNFIFNSFKQKDFNVYGAYKSSNLNENNMINIKDNYDKLLEINNIDIIIWAQGMNHNDDIYSFNKQKFLDIIDANVTFILDSLNFLLTNNKINDNCKMVIISSVWEKIIRKNKLSYSVSKSALSGLVKSLSVDLAKKNILINNILPSIIDNDMTRSNLSPTQIDFVKNKTDFNRLINMKDLYDTIYFLTNNNESITGESIKIDLGFSNLKNI